MTKMWKPFFFLLVIFSHLNLAARETCASLTARIGNRSWDAQSIASSNFILTATPNSNSSKMIAGKLAITDYIVHVERVVLGGRRESMGRIAVTAVENPTRIRGGAPLIFRPNTIEFGAGNVRPFLAAQRPRGPQQTPTSFSDIQLGLSYASVSEVDTLTFSRGNRVETVTPRLNEVRESTQDSQTKR